MIATLLKFLQRKTLAEIQRIQVENDLQHAKSELLSAHKQLEFHLAIVPMLQARVRRLEAMYEPE